VLEIVPDRPLSVEHLDASVDIEREAEAFFSNRLQCELELPAEGANRFMFAIDELTTELEWHRRELGIVNAPHPAAKAIARFEQVHIRAARNQLTGGDESR
jgi:hypothetical protein